MVTAKLTTLTNTNDSVNHGFHFLKCLIRPSAEGVRAPVMGGSAASMSTGWTTLPAFHEWAPPIGDSGGGSRAITAQIGSTREILPGNFENAEDLGDNETDALEEIPRWVYAKF